MATVEQPRAAQQVPQPALGDVLTLAEAAAYLRLDEQTVATLVQEHGLPGRQIGSQWRFIREGIVEWLKGPSQKERILALAGRFKNDTSLDEITEEIFRDRSRSITEVE